jgi:hypothetical protein
MAKETERKKDEDNDHPEDLETTIDSYTGELKPVAEDADQFIEVVPEETDDREGKNYILNEETSMDSYAADSDADAVAEQSGHYTEDEEIKADFAERQQLAVGGRNELLEDLDEHNSLSPEISGGDLDASWQTGNVAGEEAVGGSAPTPDQDRVDELGAAAGLVYRDDEPLNSDAKILDRDRNRWELNPASAEDEEEDEKDIDDEDDLDDLENALDDEEDLEGEDDLELEVLEDEEDEDVDNEEDNDIEDDIEEDEDRDL